MTENISKKESLRYLGVALISTVLAIITTGIFALLFLNGGFF